MKFFSIPTLVVFAILFSTKITAQNLLDTTTWTVGTGSVSGFTQYGVTAENSRSLGENHVGDETIIWQASPDASGAASGGFGSSYKTIDHTKDYRLSVWIKKTNSNDGHSYFKCTSYSGGVHHTLKLDGTSISWPHFWYGDLPELDRWYLLVGFIHNSGYSSTVNQGRIYDGVTGEEVATIIDYKFTTTATNLQHRAFLYGDTNIDDRQFMHSPRMEELNGFEWSLNQLLSLNPDSKLIFAYDASGNQVQRFYCRDSQCVVPPPPSEAPPSNEEGLATKHDEEEKLDSDLESELSIFPNPTKDIVTIKLNARSDLKLANSISIYSITGATVKHFDLVNDLNQKELNLKSLPTGVYYIHMHFSDGNAVTKKILKN